jgi:hypothetical protein
MIDCENLLELLASLLQSEYDTYPDVQVEVAWILTNIASGSSVQTTVVNDTEHVIPEMTRLIQTSKNKELIGQCVWCLGNICAESEAFRDVICDDYNCLNSLLQLAEGSLRENNFIPNETSIQGTDSIDNMISNTELLRVTTSTISCVCKKHPTEDIVKKVVPLVTRIIKPCITQNVLDDILVDGLWCIA